MRTAHSPLLLPLLFATAASAQDVEILGERYGTRPPLGYFDQLARDPEAFSFSRGRAVRLRLEGTGLRARAGEPAAAPLRPPGGPVTGTLTLPVVLGLFSDSPLAADMAYGADSVSASHFGSGLSVSAYYAEVSGGRLTLDGDVYEWVRTDITRADATGGESGLVRGTTGVFIEKILGQTSGVDWGLYDDDGPDGIPNSGDDDGYVDALAVFHPTPGAECAPTDRDNRVWSHKWALSAAAGRPFTTTTPSASGGFIKVDDYFIQGILSCDGTSLNEIGVFTHETGHAFGLPDLYDTRATVDGNTAGAGNWDLMASGAWGCDNASPDRPCHMGAWSKHMLGWVDVTTLAADTDHGTLTLPAVETGGDVYLVEAGDGSGEYFLLENRQAVGFDAGVYRPGLLIWQIDPDWVEAHWSFNDVNAYAHLGVWLRQADGLEQLGRSGGGRGDAGDPFPYEHPDLANDAFHAASNPASRSWGGSRTSVGTATGTTIVDVTRTGTDVTFRALTRFSRVALATQGGDGPAGLFSVGGARVDGETPSYLAAPFEPRTVEAAAGDTVDVGVRRPFDRWRDDGQAVRRRTFATPLGDTTLVALYDDGAPEYELAIDVHGGQGTVGPGTVTTTPASADRWFRDGTVVTVAATADRSFAFAGWSGALAGQPNPATATIAGPLQASADFVLTYRVVADTVRIVASEVQRITLRVEEGTNPFSWAATGGGLPEGLGLGANGQVTGTALEMGSFPLTVNVRDAVGLRVEGQVFFEVVRPEVPIAQLASPFLLVGEDPTVSQRLFLDHQGNRDGSYDLGDLRAWILANPDLPFDGVAPAVAGPRTVILRAPVGQGGGS